MDEYPGVAIKKVRLYFFLQGEIGTLENTFYQGRRNRAVECRISGHGKQISRGAPSWGVNVFLEYSVLHAFHGVEWPRDTPVFWR